MMMMMLLLMMVMMMIVTIYSDDGGDVDLGCVSLLKSKIMQIKNPDNLGFSLRKETIYPKRDHSSFISISTVSRRKNNMAADKVASLLIFPSILDG